MVKVRTFSVPLRIFHTAEELTQIDRQVNDFLAKGGISKVIAVSDVATSDDKGATMGLIRVVAYESRD